MNELYKKYLKSIDIISEEDFLLVVDATIKGEIHFDKIAWNDILHDQNSLAEDIINYYLVNWKYAYLDNVDFDNRTFELDEVNSLKDLEEIKEFFPNWTIGNYDEIKEQLLQVEEDERKHELEVEKTKLVSTLVNKLSLEEIQELLKKYE